MYNPLYHYKQADFDPKIDRPFSCPNADYAIRFVLFDICSQANADRPLYPAGEASGGSLKKNA
jgi:hypothetical protein